MTIVATADSPSGTNHPVMCVDRLRPDDLPANCSRTLYTHPAYLRANRISEVLLVRGIAPEGSSASSLTAAFAPRGDAILHLGRLSGYGADEIDRLAGAVFRSTDARFLLFESIELCGKSGVVTWPTLKFDCHANWRMGIVPGGPNISSSQRRRIRSKTRRLAETFKAEVRFEFSPAEGAVVDRIIAFNRIKVMRSGRRHCLDADAQSALKAVCAEIGHQVLIYCGDKLIAGAIICITGTNAYTMVRGYDLDYARFSPGLQVEAFAMDRLEALGCTTDNLLWGDSPWKSRMGATRVQLSTVVVARHRRTLLAPDVLRDCTPYAAEAGKEMLRRFLGWSSQMRRRFPQPVGRD